MIQPDTALLPHSTRSEETANSISHGLGLMAAIAAVPILVISAIKDGDASFVVGASVFAGSMVLLYLASTLYHSVNHEPTKRIFRLLDHSAIFVLIAGTYTPFTLGVLRGPWGWTLLAMVWSLATIGLTIKAIYGTRYKWATHDALRGNGLARVDRGEADSPSCSTPGYSAGGGGWSCLHRAVSVFLPRTDCVTIISSGTCL